MSYVDGFVIPIPKKNLKAYVKMARGASKIWMSHGALEYYECVLEDKSVPCGLDFEKSSRAKKGETVVFAWILYKSKAHRNAVNAKVMKDPRMQRMMTDITKMPFDADRMVYGGFKTLVKA
jgi:uncharacterized protein YbaA (DUF1428 family)